MKPCRLDFHHTPNCWKWGWKDYSKTDFRKRRKRMILVIPLIDPTPLVLTFALWVSSVLLNCLFFPRLSMVYQIPYFWSFLLVIITLTNICLYLRYLSLWSLSGFTQGINQLYFCVIIPSSTYLFWHLSHCIAIIYPELKIFIVPSYVLPLRQIPFLFCLVNQCHCLLLFCDLVVEVIRESGPSEQPGFCSFALDTPYWKHMGWASFLR